MKSTCQRLKPRRIRALCTGAIHVRARPISPAGDVLEVLIHMSVVEVARREQAGAAGRVDEVVERDRARLARGVAERRADRTRVGAEAEREDFVLLEDLGAAFLCMAQEDLVQFSAFLRRSGCRCRSWCTPPASIDLPLAITPGCVLSYRVCQRWSSSRRLEQQPTFFWKPCFSTLSSASMNRRKWRREGSMLSPTWYLPATRELHASHAVLSGYAPGELVRLEHHDVDAFPGQYRSGVAPGGATADDKDCYVGGCALGGAH
ncbi:unnamed protein product [Mycena citricolor]|uniref:Uncharacterized protein n=1 Tax=Mycena citricolor TaxID=2018698 RepID=A0AAD2HAY0_9AGAR|nr:unnamed protein product [Mycena citricolor]